MLSNYHGNFALFSLYKWLGLHGVTLVLLIFRISFFVFYFSHFLGVRRLNVQATCVRHSSIRAASIQIDCGRWMLI